MGEGIHRQPGQHEQLAADDDDAGAHPVDQPADNRSGDGGADYARQQQQCRVGRRHAQRQHQQHRQKDDAALYAAHAAGDRAALRDLRRLEQRRLHDRVVGTLLDAPEDRGEQKDGQQAAPDTRAEQAVDRRIGVDAAHRHDERAHARRQHDYALEIERPRFARGIGR